MQPLRKRSADFLVERAVPRHRRASRVCRRLVDGWAAIRSLAHDGAWPHDAWLRRFAGFRGLQVASLWRMVSGCHLPRSCRQAALPSRLGSCCRWASWRSSFSPCRCGPCAASPHPLGSLATAAERLGHDVNAPPLPETGTIETRQAARAFNDMQTRLRSLIENRTRLLAAISHDLRTPLTLLRLRAETVENAQERDKMLSTIAEMDAMIGATLQFARDDSASEPRRQTTSPLSCRASSTR